MTYRTPLSSPSLDRSFALLHLLLASGPRLDNLPETCFGGSPNVLRCSVCAAQGSCLSSDSGSDPGDPRSEKRCLSSFEPGPPGSDQAVVLERGEGATKDRGESDEGNCGGELRPRSHQ
mmetsp:Transcript_8684/g.24817  ORF Transcript_8684/g.24817 Transcript_8684/m.24817 type:complete len:119 (-) Transcript_8684:408-764(-)